VFLHHGVEVRHVALMGGVVCVHVVAVGARAVAWHVIEEVKHCHGHVLRGSHKHEVWGQRPETPQEVTLEEVGRTMKAKRELDFGVPELALRLWRHPSGELREDIGEGVQGASCILGGWVWFEIGADAPGQLIGNGVLRNVTFGDGANEGVQAWGWKHLGPKFRFW
jgi:hypothetical protein